MATDTGTGTGTGTALGDEPGDISAEELAAQQERTDEHATTREAVRLAADIGSGQIKGGELTSDAQARAIDWFLSDEEIPMSRTLDVNIGTPDRRYVIPWTITAISGEQIKQARKLSEEGGTRAAIARARRSGTPPEVDSQEANARILVAGSVEPDFRELAKMKMEKQGVKAPPDSDSPAVMLLKYRLAHKPGLIDLLAGEVLSLSGYDDDDIQEHAAGKH